MKECKPFNFKGIDCIIYDDMLGFEGCYGDDINRPDPRPAHRIWIKKIHAERLYKEFSMNRINKMWKFAEQQEAEE